jgi:site-specific DNA-methyltransferase (adenine-specific)
VITARANGKSGCFGNTFVGYPNEVHTKSYISFNVQSEDEAKSLVSYMKCKLPNFMLSLRKISQHINEHTCKWIPLVPLDRQWSDKQIYNYFKLSEDDILLIKNTKIVGYKEQNKIKLKTFKIDKVKGILDKFDLNVLDV